MASVSEGITVEGEVGTDLGVNSENGFAAAMAAKVTQAREPKAAPVETRSAPVAPEDDTAAAIKRQVLGTEGSTSVKDGLQTKDNEREQIRADYEESLRRIGIDPDEPAAPTPVAPEALELAQLREDKAVAEFDEATITGAMTDAAALAMLKAQVRPERVEEVLLELYGLDEGDAPEDDERWIAMAELEEEADSLLAQGRHQVKVAMAQAIQQHVSESTIQELKQTLNGWAKGEGISGAEARARIEAVEREFGYDLAAVAQEFGPDKAEDILRAGDATLRELQHAGRVSQFKESLLAEPSTSVSEGLTINAGLGHVPLVPQPELGTQINPDRITRRATSNGRTTGAEIKKAMRAESSMEADFKRVQGIAGRMAEEARPKPTKGI